MLHCSFPKQPTKTPNKQTQNGKTNPKLTKIQAKTTAPVFVHKEILFEATQLNNF